VLAKRHPETKILSGFLLYDHITLIKQRWGIAICCLFNSVFLISCPITLLGHRTQSDPLAKVFWPEIFIDGGFDEVVRVLVGQGVALDGAVGYKRAGLFDKQVADLERET
jgi:hypothetical protein